ncbi:MAG: hypothetical protein GY847_09435 [Proteobacteria bacterium]|nr:hypothetical protein [Pseudomonadota bacterium]
MKLGSKDQAYKILITGPELTELKNHALDLPESFGLDRRIEQYKGTRPIGLFRWDLDYLTDVLEMVTRDKHEYPDKTSPEYKAVQSLYERLSLLRQQAYDDLERS